MDIFRLLDSEFADAPVLVAGKPAASDVDLIERFAGFDLPIDYSKFVERYGAAIVGPYPVYGVGASEAMGDGENSIITVTRRFRSDGWPGTGDTLVISMDHAGNAMTMDAKGAVRRFDHDAGETDDLGRTFTGFLQWCLRY